MHDSIPFTPKQPDHHVSNAQFLRAICKKLVTPKAYLWVSSFPGDPNDAGPASWIGMPIFTQPDGTFYPAVPEQAGENSFFVISHFCQDESDRDIRLPSRSKAQFSGMHVLAIDDVGSGLGGKIGWDALVGMPEPSWVLETSPGSCQVGYILSIPVEDAAMASALIQALVYQGLRATDDPGMLGVTRYLRMPVGTNGKAKYAAGNGGQPWQHRLVHWRPELTYETWQLTAAFGLDVNPYLSNVSRGSGGFGSTRGCLVAEDDPWYALVSEVFDAKGTLKLKGPADAPEQWQDISCPWAHDHTDGIDNGAAYIVGGGFSCHHGHCNGSKGDSKKKTWIDLRELLRSGGHECRQDIREAAQTAYRNECFRPEMAGRFEAWEARRVAHEAAQGQVRAARAVQEAQAQAQAQAQVVQGSSGVQATGGWAGAPPPSFGAPEFQLPGHDYAHIMAEVGLLEPNATPAQVEAIAKLIGESPGLNEIEIDAIGDEVKTRAGTPKAAFMRVVKIAKAKAQGVRVAHQATMTMLQNQASGGVPEKVFIPETDWPSKDAEGRPILRDTNVDLLLQRAGVRVRANLMTKGTDYLGVFDSTAWGAGTALVRIAGWAADNGLVGRTDSPQKLAPYIEAIASADEYHPFAEYLDHLPAWDGVDRLRAPGGLYSTLEVVRGQERHRTVILDLWFRSLIAAARGLYLDPSVEADSAPKGVLTILGDQSAGKTTWLRRLFSRAYPGGAECFAEGMHMDSGKDAVITSLGSLCVELGELDATTRKADVGALKAILSRKEDIYRKPWAIEAVRHPRRTVFAGTVNETKFLRDQTGNKRFWCLTSTNTCLDAQRKLDMSAIWSQVDYECLSAWEAVKHNDIGLAPWLPTSEQASWIDRNNERFRVTTSQEDLLLDTFNFDHEAWVCADEETRYSFNPMSAQNIQVACHRSAHGLGRLSDLWRDALTRLTGVPGPTGTTTRIATVPHDGEVGSAFKEQRRGRLWPMPPLRAANLPVDGNGKPVAAMPLPAGHPALSQKH